MVANRIPFPARGIAGTFAGALGAGVFIFVGGALAQTTTIGAATVVQNEVRGHTGGEIFRIARNDSVFLDELVQTSANSRAKVVFLDTTNMSVGPDSIVKLDQFVYNGNGTAQSVSIAATKGAFRFFSGASEHRAYKVTTPQAVIGVRGTTYDVLIANGRTIIKLQEGAVTACVRTGSACRDVDQPGQYLVVSDTSVEGPFNADNSTFDFGVHCGGGNADLCRKTQFAMNVPPPPPGGRPQPPAPTRFAANPPPAWTSPPPAPSSPPPIRNASLPSSDGFGPTQVLPPPVYVPPPRQTVHVPPVYVPPARPPVYVPPQRPPVYVPPRRPPQSSGTGPTRPPQDSGPRPRPYPQVPKQEGRPHPRPNTGTPGPILRYGQRGGPSRVGQVNRYDNIRRMQQGPRYAMNQPRSMPRMSSIPRMNAPRVNAPRFNAPRMSAPRMSAGPRMAARSFGGGSGFGRRR